MSKKFLVSSVLGIFVLLGAGCVLPASTTLKESVGQELTEEEVADNDGNSAALENTSVGEETAEATGKQTGAEDDEKIKNEAETTEQLAGRYEDYDPSQLVYARTGKVVLFFKASWCPTCRALDKDIVSNFKSIPNGVAILKVDYDSAIELKKKYGITYQHTFVQVDAGGNMLKKWSASPTLAALAAEIK